MVRIKVCDIFLVYPKIIRLGILILKNIMFVLRLLGWHYKLYHYLCYNLNCRMEIIMEIKNKKLEQLIRIALNKPTEPITKDDIVLLKPMIQSLAAGGTTDIEYRNLEYSNFQNKIEEIALTTKAEHLLRLYRRIDGYRDRRYQKIFGLCVLLGVTDIYDIGCGFEWQVAHILNLKEISYTGIDMVGRNFEYVRTSDGNQTKSEKEISIDFMYYTNLFSELNENIRFINNKYPCVIHPQKDNLGIAIGADFLIEDTSVAEALARDFERIVFQVKFHEYNECEKIFSGFSLMELNRTVWYNYFTKEATNKGIVTFLATRYRKEIECLKKIGYNYNDDRFFVDSVDKTKYLENLTKK